MNHPWRVAYNDFKRIGVDRDLRAVERVLKSGSLILGEEVVRFEEAWASYCGTACAVGVGNGLDAIEIGLRVVGVGPGDEVITTPMTALATVLGVMRSGATPVLADIDPTTGLLDPESVEKCITGSTRAVLLVHLYGQMRDMAAWHDFCHSRGLLLLEDCAQAHGASDGGQRAGAWGAFGAFSFYPTKNLGAAGDAGAIVVDDPEWAARARALRNYGQSVRYEHPLVGLNSRLDEIQAGILLERLSGLDDATARRREIAERYREELDPRVVQPLAVPLEAGNHVYHHFVVLVDRRDALQRHLAEQGIQALTHYPVPVHLQESMHSIRMEPDGLPSAELHAKRCLSLTCSPHLTNADVAEVIRAVNKFRP